MKMLLLDPTKGFSTVEANGLEDYYRHLNCNCIDIVRRKIGNEVVDIVCDDEGLLKEHPILSGLDKEDKPMLVGNLLFAGTADEEGNLTQISRESAANIIINSVKRFEKTKEGLELRCLVVCDYED